MNKEIMDKDKIADVIIETVETDSVLNRTCRTQRSETRR
jgi:hypothetical protein